MKKFLIIALIGLLGLNGYLLNKLASLTARFEKIDSTIENLSKINNQNKELRDINNLIFQSNYKDDLVLNNFNLTIGIILGFFTILIGLGVYLSFQRIDEDIKELKESATTIEETASKVENSNKNIKQIAIEIEDAKVNIQDIALEIKNTKLEINNFQKRYFFTTTESLIIESHMNQAFLIAYFIENKHKKIDTYILNKSIHSAINNFALLIQLQDIHKENRLQLEINDTTKVVEKILEETNIFIKRNENITSNNAFLLYTFFEKIAENKDMYYLKVFELGDIKEKFSTTLKLLEKIQHQEKK